MQWILNVFPFSLVYEIISGILENTNDLGRGRLCHGGGTAVELLVHNKQRRVLLIVGMSVKEVRLHLYPQPKES